ncbi:MAG: site-specific DNA-methyltransferase [Eubacteriales bacterium]|jgi:adenine-specific DNA-methyltransferase
MTNPKFESPDITAQNIEKIAALFPNCVTEASDGRGGLKYAVNFDMLKQMLSPDVVDGDERYEFTWVGKKASVVEANKPIRKTLRPCPEESRDWDTTENLYIEGDNLEVLKLLQESYLGKVKMIYIDPPYNTGKNYIYRNDFSVDKDEYDNEAGFIDTDGSRLVANPINAARFHSAWMSMMYQRLLVARNLLSADGVMVIAIDENEFASLAIMVKEIFGESGYEHSYVSIVHNPRGQQGLNFSYVNEYMIFVYPKNGKKYLADFPKDEVDSRNLRDSGTESDRTDAKMCFYPFYVKNGKIINIGDVPDDSFHPKSANVLMDDGTIEIWPMTDNGDEKKWRYARQSVETIFEKLEPKMGRNLTQIIFNKNEGTMRSVWANARYDSSEYGTKLLDELFGGASFTFPKSIYAVLDCVMAITKEDNDALVVDFFSGSGTTAHAVMEMNKNDGGNRKYIMVQLPEDLDEALLRPSDRITKDSIKEAINFLDSIGKKHNICEIGKERIRRAGDKIKAESPLTTENLDIGFRVLKLDDTNMKDVYYSPEEYSQDIVAALELNIKEDRTDLDLLFGCLIDWALPLSRPYSSETISGCAVHTYNDGDLIACFAENVPEDVVKTIARRKPLRAVFRDSSFANSPEKINVFEIFKMLAPDTKVKVI